VSLVGFCASGPRLRGTRARSLLASTDGSRRGLPDGSRALRSSMCLLRRTARAPCGAYRNRRIRLCQVLGRRPDPRRRGARAEPIRSVAAGQWRRRLLVCCDRLHGSDALGRCTCGRPAPEALWGLWGWFGSHISHRGWLRGWRRMFLGTRHVHDGAPASKQAIVRPRSRQRGRGGARAWRRGAPGPLATRGRGRAACGDARRGTRRSP